MTLEMDFGSNVSYMMAILVRTVLLGGALLASANCEAGRFGSKTAYPLIPTEWQDVLTSAGLPSTCQLVHMRAVLRHGTRSYGADDGNDCRDAASRIGAAGAKPETSGGGITDAQLKAIVEWKSVLPEDKGLLPQGIVENHFLASDYLNLTRLQAGIPIQTDAVLFESSSVARAKESGEAFREEWAYLTDYGNLQPVEVNITRNYFHKNCTAYLEKVKNNKTANVEYESACSQPHMKALVDIVNLVKLGLSSNVLTCQDLMAMHKVASVEVAAGIDSAFLPLFDTADLQLLTYVDDLENYWAKTYSVDDVTRHMSCGLTNHVFETARRAFDEGPAASPSMFGFTHMEIVLPVFGAFGLFFDPREAFVASAPSHFYMNRRFDTSTIGCYASNLAFLFFQCSQSAPPNDRLVVFVSNGQAHPLPRACPSSVACPFDKVMEAYPFETGLHGTCNYDNICWPSENGSTTFVLSQAFVLLLVLLTLSVRGC